MFKKASVADEVLSSFKQYHDDILSLGAREQHAKFAKAVECLMKAADILDDVGLEAYADNISSILSKVSWEVPTNDPATSGLTSEQMEKNLAEKGWVFNADDGQVLEVVETTGDEVPQLNDTDGSIEVEEDSAKVDDEAKLDADMIQV